MGSGLVTADTAIGLGGDVIGAPKDVEEGVEVLSETDAQKAAQSSPIGSVSPNIIQKIYRWFKSKK